MATYRRGRVRDEEREGRREGHQGHGYGWEYNPSDYRMHRYPSHNPGDDEGGWRDWDRAYNRDNEYYAGEEGMRTYDRGYYGAHDRDHGEYERVAAEHEARNRYTYGSRSRTNQGETRDWPDYQDRREHARRYEPELPRGPHTGRGPAGYQRRNEHIHEEVCERLTRHGQVDARNITIKVEDGEVTLEGHVESRREKRAAEDAIHTIRGVRDVHNRLRVRRPEERVEIAE